MPDPRSPAPSAAIDQRDLPQAAALAVLGVPAVLRLEPTLRNALHRLQATASRSRPGEATLRAQDGISLRRHGDVVDIHVDIAVSAHRPADRTAAAAQAALRSYVTAHQLTPGAITVAVLAVEH